MFLNLALYCWSLLQNKVNMEVLQKQIFPVSLFFAISLVLSNKAYIYLSVSYIQVKFTTIPQYTALTSPTCVQLNFHFK